jgi:peptide-methionine (R)-S-oxide reductase
MAFAGRSTFMKQGLLVLSLIMVFSYGVSEAQAPKASPKKSDRTSDKSSAGKGTAVKEKYNPETCAFPQDDKELKGLLSPEQYEITKKNGTEMPFRNAYWDNHHPGIYVDVISREPLFSSKEKFDSGTGWPSFSEPLKKAAVVEKKDISHGMVRKEVRSARADSHLGHIFDDGPGKDGLRYCINSGSLTFIPLEKMKEEGYEDWIGHFSDKEMAEARKSPYTRK